jgi:transposase
MGKPHRRFGKEFEAESVRLVETSGRTQREMRRISASGFRRCVAGSTNVVSAIWKRPHPNGRKIWRRS